MRTVSILFRAATGAIATLAAVATLGAAATPAAASHPAATRTFAADHERGCTYSYTSGSLIWGAPHWGILPAVQVVGVLGVKTDAGCADAGETFAEFTAYVQGKTVDYETVTMTALAGSGAGERSFRLSLYPDPARPTSRIDQVDVRVCRTLGPMLPAFSCGATATYRFFALTPPAAVPV
jgi:hypothetical protein